MIAAGSPSRPWCCWRGAGASWSRGRRAGCPARCSCRPGFAAIVVVGQSSTLADATAELTAPVVVALGALAASALNGRAAPGRPGGSPPRGRGVRDLRRADLASGDATFGGYIKLDDTATWMALTDRVMEHGRKPRRPGAVVLRGDARRQPRRRLSNRRLHAARRRGRPHRQRPRPGSSSRTWPCSRPCFALCLVGAGGAAGRLPRAARSWSRSPRRPRCSSATSMGRGQGGRGRGADRPCTPCRAPRAPEAAGGWMRRSPSRPRRCSRCSAGAGCLAAAALIALAALPGAASAGAAAAPRRVLAGAVAELPPVRPCSTAACSRRHLVVAHRRDRPGNLIEPLRPERLAIWPAGDFRLTPTVDSGVS